MRSERQLAGLLPCVLLFVLVSSGSAAAKGELDCSVEFKKSGLSVREWHNPGLAKITDHEVCFEGYVSNFDGDDDEDGDGEPDLLGVPHWVVHRVDRAPRAPESRARPRPWFTVDALASADIAPTDASYVFSQRWRKTHPDWFERGHLAQKYLLERIGADAAWYSHNIANAVPQRGRFNKSAWLDLECRIGAWANEFGTVWVITGPVFEAGAPRDWLLEPRRPGLPVAIPDAMFKIVVRKVRNDFRALTFIMPQADRTYTTGKWDLVRWTTSIARIETLTKQEFFPGFAGSSQFKTAKETELWPRHTRFFDPGCKRFAREEP